MFSGPMPGWELEAVAVTFVRGRLYGSVVKLHTAPLETVAAGAAPTSSTRQ